MLPFSAEYLAHMAPGRRAALVALHFRFVIEYALLIFLCGLVELLTVSALLFIDS